MKRLLLLVLGVAVVVGLAAYYVPAPAATVGSGSVTRQQLDRDLSAIAGSGGYQCYLSEKESLAVGRPVSVQVEGVGQTAGTTGPYNTSFVDTWLSQMVDAQVARQVLAQHAVNVTGADLTVGRSVLERRITEILDTFANDEGTTPSCGGSGAAVLASVPSAFAAEQVRAQTEQSLLEAKAAGAGLTGSRVASYFTAHRGEFDKVCLSVIVVATKTKAAFLAAGIKGGASFAQVAKTYSIDSTTASNGGIAGCGVIAGTTLLKPLENLAINQLSAPIPYNGDYLLAEVTGRTAEKFTTVATTVMTVMLIAGQSKADAEVTAALQKADVTVDARFGHVKHGTSQIEPPSHPPLDTLLTARANTPSGASTTG